MDAICKYMCRRRGYELFFLSSFLFFLFFSFLSIPPREEVESVDDDDDASTGKEMLGGEVGVGSRRVR